MSAAAILHAFGWPDPVQQAWDRVLTWIKDPWVLTVEGGQATVWHPGNAAQAIVADGVDENDAIVRLDAAIRATALPLITG